MQTAFKIKLSTFIFKHQFQYFIWDSCEHGITNGKKPAVITPEESREAIRVCLAAEESAATGKVVTL